MHPWQSFVLGIVEGVTEYLPISSTGHLILAERALGLANDEALRAYTVCIQAGAILAVLSIYWPRVKQMLAGLAGRDAAGRKLALLVAVAVVPAGVIGMAFKKSIERELFGLWPVVSAWMVGGIVIVCVRKLRTGRQSGIALETMGFGTALAIGFCQALALAPGTSRSLVTIGGALLLGLSSAAAVEFSMLLGVVTLLAATAVEAHAAGGAMWHEYGAANLAIGFLAAFVSAFLAVKWFIAWLQARGLFVFGIYRIALAVLVAAWIALGGLGGSA